MKEGKSEHQLRTQLVYAGVPRIRNVPNADVLMVADGLPKLVWLNKPNDSKRNWNLNRSPIGKFLNNEKFTDWVPGPTSRLRPAFPYA